jgi:hypothetical protein
MRNFLRCRRGSVAFALVVALIPRIRVLALGGETGTWYVTKRHAQNAAGRIWRRRLLDTPLTLFTRTDTATLGG